MGLSETILAAMIGAVATVSTALFQLFSAIRQRRVDSKPRKGNTLRSVLAVLALMVASAAGGFLYSEFLKERNAEDLRAMRAELRELKELTAAAAQVHEPPAALVAAPTTMAEATTAALVEDIGGMGGSIESIAYVPACRRADSAACAEADAQRIALCGTVPVQAHVSGIDLYAQQDAARHAWDAYRASFEQDLGGARFTGRSFEYAQGGESRAVCVNFAQWSSEHPYIARIVVSYDFGAPEPSPVSPPVIEMPVAATPAVIAADTLSAEQQAVSLAPGVALP